MRPGTLRPGIMRPAAPPLILATEAIPGGRSYPPMPPQTQRLTISGMRKGERPMLEKLAASRQRDAGFAHTP